MQCPQCNSDNTQRLEVIYDAGTHDIRTKSTGAVGGLGTGGVTDMILGAAITANTTKGTQQTIAAQKAAPPQQKRLATWLKWIAFLGIFFLFIPTIIVAFVWFRNMKWNKTEYVALYEEWQRTWYCNKCGNIFKQA
jgi:hypothetical protein